jgi:exosortase
MGLILVASLSVLAEGVGHAQPVFLGIIGLSVMLATFVLALDRGETPLVRLNGASLAGIGIWCFAVPLGPLESITMVLRNHTAEWVLQTLILLGIPAVRHGNILEFSNHFVGVEDACSGIRSLLACLYTGLFLGGLMLRGIWPRLVLVFAGGFLAIVANFFRSTVLCLLVYRGIDIKDSWHDSTAYATLGVTVLLLFALVSLIGHDEGPEKPVLGVARTPPWTKAIPLGLCSLSLVIAALVVWRTRTPEHEQRQTPDLKALLTVEAPGWVRRDNQEIQRFAASLGTETLFETSYLRSDVEVTFYLAYWAAGQSTLGIVGLHRPDVCLPNSGWIEKQLPAPIAEYPLGQVQRYAYEYEGSLHHLWFWHFYGGRIVEHLPGFYPWQLGPYILKRPSGARAAQWVIRVSSNRPVEELSQDPLLKEVFRRLEAAGLGEQGP